MREFVSVDIETSGLDYRRHEIIEVGLVADDWEHTFSLPFDIEKAEQRALEVNGWGQRPFPDTVPNAWAVGFLAVTLTDKHIVGKNPSFDMDFIRTLFWRYNETPTWHHRMVDVGALAWGFHNGLVAEAAQGPRQDIPPNVATTAMLIDVPLDSQDAHTALGDARWAHRVFRKIVPRQVEVPATT